MPMTFTECPACGRRLQLPEEVLGKQVQCPSCRSTFLAQAQSLEQRDRTVPVAQEAAPAPADQVPSAAAEAAAPQLSIDDDDNPVIPAGQLPPPPLSLRPVLLEAESADEPFPPARTRRCPSCHEMIPQSAAYCRFCGEEVTPRKDQWDSLRRDCEPHRGGLILALGVIGLVASFLYIFALVGLPLSIAAWTMAETDLKRIKARTMDPEGKANTQAGKVCGIFGTLIGSLWVMVFCCIGFDIFLR
jgi:hypothetical protein